MSMEKRIDALEHRAARPDKDLPSLVIYERDGDEEAKRQAYVAEHGQRPPVVFRVVYHEGKSKRGSSALA